MFNLAGSVPAVPALGREDYYLPQLPVFAYPVINTVGPIFIGS